MAPKQWSLPTPAVPSDAVLLSRMLRAQWPLSGPKKPKSFTVTGPCGFSPVPSLFFPNSSSGWPSHSLGVCLNIIFFFPKRYSLTFLIVGHCCYSLSQQCIYFLIPIIWLYHKNVSSLTKGKPALLTLALPMSNTMLAHSRHLINFYQMNEYKSSCFHIMAAS